MQMVKGMVMGMGIRISKLRRLGMEADVGVWR